MNFFAKAWNGKSRLAVVYWCLLFPLGYALRVADFLNAEMVVLLLILPHFFSLIAVWRCAYNTQSPICGHIARSVVILNWVFFVVGFLFGIDLPSL